MNETMLTYLQDRMKDGNAVLAADKMVTEKEKWAEGWKSWFLNVHQNIILYTHYGKDMGETLKTHIYTRRHKQKDSYSEVVIYLA